MDQARSEEIIQRISRCLQGLRLYPAQHPAVQRQVEECQACLAALLEERSLLQLGLHDGTLFFDDHLFAYSGPAEEELSELLKRLEVEHLEFLPGLTGNELLGFLKLLASGGPRGDAFAKALSDAGIRHIRLPETEEEEEDEGKKQPRKVYKRALKVVENIFSDVRLGKIPSTEEAVAAVKGMVEVTLADPHALFALSMIKDYDHYTFTHSVNVSVIALAVGRANALSPEQLRILGLGGLLHDLGKLKVDVGIITKPGRLTEAEFEQIKKHPAMGAEIVRQMDQVPPEVVEIVLGHHVRHNRQGYPSNVLDSSLSPLVEMAAIADTYDAITTLRSYQRPMTPRNAIKRMEELSGSVLHPLYLERFIGSLGHYPVGSLVRLNTNEIGLVIRVGTKNPDAVELKMLFDSSGTALAEPAFVDLSGPEASDAIVAEVDPFVKGVDVTEHFP